MRVLNNNIFEDNLAQEFTRVCTQLKEDFGNKPPMVSFEFFPANNEDLAEKQWLEIKKLEKLSPKYFSVTYGAGGSTKDKTFSLVNRIKKETSIPPAAHLTCVGASKQETNEIAKNYFANGINRIVALRGDLPGMEGKYIPKPDGYAFADDLVAGLKEIGDFDISVAAYPEVHPAAISAEDDMAHLKRKCDAGATRAITQYCFDTDDILKFIEKARKIGVKMPIVPGIVTITNFKQVVNFSKKCGASIPKWLENIFSRVDESPEQQKMAAAIIALEQCRLLQKEGIEEFHFYTLNKAEICNLICNFLGVVNNDKVANN